MFDYADDDTLKYHQDLFTKWKIDGFKGGNPEMNKVLTLFNSIEGVATRYSSASNLEQLKSDFHIQFIVSKLGFEKLNQVFIIVRNIILTLNLKHLRGDEIVFSLSIVKNKGNSIPTAVFRVRVISQETKKQLLLILEEALEQFIGDIHENRTITSNIKR